MKTFGKVLLWILGIIVLLVIISYLLPRTYKVERSITIASKPEIVYGLVSNLNRWDLWTAWNKEYDTTLVYEMSDEDGQVGTVKKWNGKLTGNGEMTITELLQNELLSYDLLLDNGTFKSKGQMIIRQEGDSLNVTWTDEGDMGYNPLTRYMGLLMDNMMGPDFEKGLKKLKEIAEARKDWPVIIEKEMEAMPALLVRDSAGPETYGSVLGRAYGEIMAVMKSQDLDAAGAPFAIYLTWDSVTMRSTMDIGMPVIGCPSNKGRVRYEIIPVQKIVMTSYFGPYENCASFYAILEQYIRETGKEIAGPPWEIYITDPMIEKDTSKWQTDIFFPVR